MCQETTLGIEEACIYQFLFTIIQLFQENLFKLMLHKLKKNPPSKKNPSTFPTSFQTISNQITSPIKLLNNFAQSCVKMSHIKTQNL